MNTAQKTGSSTTAAEQDFTITRVFDAPRDLVWKAVTEPERLMRWWGPKGFTMQVARMELRPGGVFHYGMRSPGGSVMWGRFVYREIAAPERLVFINTFSDEQGSVTPNPFSTTWPLEVFNTWSLAEQDGKTTLTLRGRPFNASEAEEQAFREGYTSMQGGFKGTLDQLEQYLAQLKA